MFENCLFVVNKSLFILHKLAKGSPQVSFRLVSSQVALQLSSLNDRQLEESCQNLTVKGTVHQKI